MSSLGFIILYRQMHIGAYIESEFLSNLKMSPKSVKSTHKQKKSCIVSSNNLNTTKGVKCTHKQKNWTFSHVVIFNNLSTPKSVKVPDKRKKPAFFLRIT